MNILGAIGGLGRGVVRTVVKYPVPAAVAGLGLAYVAQDAACRPGILGTTLTVGAVGLTGYAGVRLGMAASGGRSGIAALVAGRG